jgi:hypothetical protein
MCTCTAWTGTTCSMAPRHCRRLRHGCRALASQPSVQQQFACSPVDLRAVLTHVRQCQAAPPSGARVLGAHLESNFINPAMCGAQPVEHLRLPPSSESESHADFTATDVLEVIAAFRAEVAIVTVAPELPGGLELVRVAYRGRATASRSVTRWPTSRRPCRLRRRVRDTRRISSTGCRRCRIAHPAWSALCCRVRT